MVSAMAGESVGSFSRRRKWARSRCRSVSLEGWEWEGKERYGVAQQGREEKREEILAVRKEGK